MGEVGGNGGDQPCVGSGIDRAVLPLPGLGDLLDALGKLCGNGVEGGMITSQEGVKEMVAPLGGVLFGVNVRAPPIRT